MTAIVRFDGEIDIGSCFPLFNPARLTKSNPVVIGRRKKIRPPTAEKAGDIISARYGGITLGMVSSTEGNDFENSITLDVSAGEKVVNVKLCRTCAHVSGAKSRDMARRAVQYLVTSLIHIQQLIDWIIQNPQSSEEILDWVEKSTRGDIFLYYTPHIIEWLISSSGQMILAFLPGKKAEFETKLKPLTTEDIPQHFYQPLTTYLLDSGSKFSNHEAYMAQLQWIYNLEKIIEKPLDITHVKCEMVNFNYSLGFRIRRVALCKAIEASGTPFKARYSNIYNNSVNCTYPCQVEEGKPPRYCTLLIYVTGRVTQSGPNPEWGMFVYREYLNLIENFRHDIVYEQPAGIIKIPWR